MSIFGKPNIETLRRKGKVRKLIKIVTVETDYNIRRRAVSALGILGDKRAVQPLCKVLTEAGSSIRTLAAEALGDIGDSRAIKSLIRCLDSSAADLVITSATALGMIGTKEALDGLKQRMDIKAPEIHKAVIKAIGMVGSAESVEALIEAFDAEPQAIKAEIIRALGYSSEKSADEFLKKVYPSSDISLRTVIAKILTEKGWKPETGRADLWVEDDVSTDSFWLPPKILALIEEKSDLPAIPEIVIRITSMVNEADCTLNEISKLIKTDPSLSARIVQVANSAFYGSGLMEISDVQTSVTRLGLLQLRNIVLAFSVLKQFESVKLINKQQFWIHSFVVAQISKSLAKLLGQPEEVQEQAYMAGLMHDIGIVVMTYILPDIYERLLRIKTGRSIKNSHSTLQDEEIHVFKTNHAAIGAAYIRHWWPVDEVIVAAVGNHHGSVRSKNNSIIDNVIIAANIYCQSMGLDNSVNFAVNPSEFDREIFRLISLTDPQIEEFINNFESEVESAEMIMSSG